MHKRQPWWQMKTNADIHKVIGLIIYEPYQVSRVGKIIDAWMHKSGRAKIPVCKIRWLKQTKKYPIKESQHGMMGLNYYEDLMESHKRKYENMSKIFKEAIKL